MSPRIAIHRSCTRHDRRRCTWSGAWGHTPSTSPRTTWTSMNDAPTSTPSAGSSSSARHGPRGRRRTHRRGMSRTHRCHRRPPGRARGPRCRRVRGNETSACTPPAQSMQTDLAWKDHPGGPRVPDALRMQRACLRRTASKSAHASATPARAVCHDVPPRRRVSPTDVAEITSARTSRSTRTPSSTPSGRDAAPRGRQGLRRRSSRASRRLATLPRRPASCRRHPDRRACRPGR